MQFKTPAMSPHDPKNQADEFERHASLKFPQDSNVKEYYERVTEGGREWMRYMQPVWLSRDCLLCHGDPAGAKDPFGYTKEGMKEGDLRGRFEVKAPMDELVANASSNSRMLFLTSLFTLLAAAGAVALVVRGTVIKAVGGVRASLVALAGRDLAQRIKVHSKDEVGQMAEALNATGINRGAALQKIDHESTELTPSSEKMSKVSQNIRANPEETSAQVNAVSAATEEVNRNLQMVVTATEEMSASMQEIAKSATEAARIAERAMKSAADADRTVSKFGASSSEIGQVINKITSIAQKTDLLALNATVEAARAGEVGADFAVVANEAEELAKQTATATEEISRKLEAIRIDARDAVESIKTISSIIDQVNQISTTIATAVEEQSATTSEMSRNLSEAAKGSGEMAQNIHGVAGLRRARRTAPNILRKRRRSWRGCPRNFVRSCSSTSSKQTVSRGGARRRARTRSTAPCTQPGSCGLEKMQTLANRNTLLGFALQ